MPASDWLHLDRMHGKMLCPVCGKPDWCMVKKDGTAAICQRTHEGYDRETKGGKLFRLDNGEGRVVLPRNMKRYDPPPPSPPPNWNAIIPPMLAGTTDVHLQDFSDSVGVSVDSLKRLEAGYSPKTQTWGFPIRRWSGEYNGVLLRRRDREVRSRWRKWCVRGSRMGDGLHVPKGTFTGSAIDFYPGEDEAERNDCVLCIAEGVTDTAVLMDFGFHVIGRTSCLTGVEPLSRINGRIVWIFADDEIKRKPRGEGYYNPELEGAYALAKRLYERNMQVRIVRPMAGKDIRSWVRKKHPKKSTVIAVANSAPRMTERGLV